MTTVLAKTEKFLVYGPQVIWVGMNLVIALTVDYQLGLKPALFYLMTFLIFGSLVIWHFGYRLFPAYLAADGKITSKVALQILINLLLFIPGICGHLISELYVNQQTVPHAAPVLVRAFVWVLMVLLGMILMGSIQLARAYHYKTVERMENQVRRVEAELQLLKNQISPHFLFNTLNNIYGLAYLRDERAAVMISKLSQLMRYLLYDCNQQRVPLIKEKDLIEHYLSLQHLKHEGNLNVDFYHAGIHYDQMISPMILINFIENCFKHSDLENNPKGWIKISMEAENQLLSFRTENTVRRGAESKPGGQQGIGLTNSHLLLKANYPDKYTLDIQQDEDVFQLQLTVQL